MLSVSTKKIIGRFQQKNDTEANWNKASNFIPMVGEFIIYNKDENYNYERLKIGDGIHSIVDLPFVISSIDNEKIEQLF